MWLAMPGVSWVMLEKVVRHAVCLAKSCRYQRRAITGSKPVFPDLVDLALFSGRFVLSEPNQPLGLPPEGPLRRRPPSRDTTERASAKVKESQKGMEDSYGGGVAGLQNDTTCLCEKSYDLRPSLPQH